jgi:hypothetical protein
MQHETTVFDYAQFFVELEELNAQSHQLCEESRALCAISQRQRSNSPWPPPIPEVPPPQQEDAVAQPVLDPHDVAMEALRLMRSIIDPFPLEWQVAIVKALTARTILTGHERTRPAPAVMSA